MNLSSQLFQFSASYPRRSAFMRGGFLFVLLVLGTGSAVAQHGGKAEPNRIEFKRGATSTTISGVVHGDEQAEYILSAKQGQRLTIKLTNVPAKSSCFVTPAGGASFDCARAASGHASAPAKTPRNSRRLIPAPDSE